MADPASPLCQRGPEAFHRLLAGDVEAAEAQLRLLTRTELGKVATAAREIYDAVDRVVGSTWPKAGD